MQPAQAAGPITNGDSPTDTIDFDGEIDTWTFSANSGDGIRVNIGATDRVNFTPLIRLYDPGSTQVASNQGTFSADITWQAAQSGTYTVEVLDSSGTPNGTATYTLYLATIPGSFIIPAGDEGGEPKNGGVVNPGSIDLGDMDLWTYPADAGDTLLIHVGEINGTGLGPELVLYSPDGVELGSSNSTDATVLDHPAAVAG
ncbi:MAG: pre-peptidase C-terminal domain-containing protein, partial [Gammaproteobacteria bacterium]|nr:pre-peptidase C-terminal domain-containing protein [Gammaproteobacteria bacterium]